MPDAEAAAAAVARQIAETVATKPDAVLGLATGGTMEPVYAHLVRAHREGLSFARVRTVNLDEYMGLPPDHPNSYHSYMARHFLDHVDIPRGQSFIPRGEGDADAAAREYAALLERLGPVDLQLLGVGHNGHIAFNEPGTPIDATTRVVRLSDETRQANRRFFAEGETVPAEAVTMGTAQILSARSLLALAVGEAKAAALSSALDGPVDPDCPASYLRLHPSCTIFADKAASSGLRGR
ncbi:glucosamine-6-phosphate deaminase [Paracoccus methylarcula]|uniref:Glucosamine-6-phosphate deaminase n=2 Tax=Paracoccus methylarcula TaxID=72022 RepID=A0A422QTF0_9RHOB|nr:glucosamine-6-phosphate deaminase [Paracoccus methylarcula]